MEHLGSRVCARYAFYIKVDGDNERGGGVLGLGHVRSVVVYISTTMA